MEPGLSAIRNLTERNVTMSPLIRSQITLLAVAGPALVKEIHGVISIKREIHRLWVSEQRIVNDYEMVCPPVCRAAAHKLLCDGKRLCTAAGRLTCRGPTWLCRGGRSRPG
jgi:hypothetical protein